MNKIVQVVQRCEVNIRIKEQIRDRVPEQVIFLSFFIFFANKTKTWISLRKLIAANRLLSNAEDDRWLEDSNPRPPRHSETEIWQTSRTQ